jgi:two-component system chemotaxis response regulator CheB
MNLSSDIKLLIVDDSAIVRKALSDAFEKVDGITVVGTAIDPYVARKKILTLKPDVITLDIEMPRMDGLTFLKKLMAQHPIPTIILSSLTKEGGEMAIEAMAIGAVDVLCKPGAAYTVGEVIPNLITSIRAAALVDLKKRASFSRPKSQTIKKYSITTTTNKIIAIGASTGGTVALEKYLTQLPANSPGIVIVQHMPMTFTKSFAARLNSVCSMSVKEAEQGDTVSTGVVLLAPGNFHMLLNRSGSRYYVDIVTSPQLFHQRPAVELLFNSVAKYAGKNAVGIILTGMGKDGAEGLLNMRKSGAKTIAQDQKSSVVWGMPGEATKIGAADFVLPLSKIAEKSLLLSQPES